MTIQATDLTFYDQLKCFMFYWVNLGDVNCCFILKQPNKTLWIKSSAKWVKRQNHVCALKLHASKTAVKKVLFQVM